MPLDLSAALRRHLLQRFPATRDYPRAALRADGMPPLIGTFLDRTLDRWVEIERAQIHSDWFDFESPEVQEAEARFFDALTRNARIPAEAWKGTLGGTVVLVVRYLTTPARALTDAIFEGSADPLPADAVRARLPMFDAYPYFAEVGGAYLERKQTESLEPPDLFGLLDRIDRRVVSEFGADEWVDLLAPLFALTRHVPEFDGVPASLLKRFFEMKGEPDLAMPIGKHVDTALDEDALHYLISKVLDEGDPLDVAPVRTNGHARPDPVVEKPVEPESDAEIETPTLSVPGPEADELDLRVPDEVESEPSAEPVVLEAEQIAEEEEDDEPEPHAVAEPEVVESEPEPTPLPEPAPIAPELDGAMEDGGEDSEDEEGVPLWKRYAASDDANVNAQFSGGDAEPSDGTDDVGDAEREGAPLWKRFFSRPDERPAPLPLSADVEPTPMEAIPPERPARASSLDELERRVLGASTSGQRTRFVKHLFGGDAGKYATVLHTLDAAGSWTEASQIIARDVFRPFRVNIYGEHAVAFTDAVEARFRA